MKTTRTMVLVTLLLGLLLGRDALAFYNPQTGRWLSRDPIKEEVSGPNLQCFNFNDALGHADYDGQQSWPTGKFPIPGPPSGPGFADPRPSGWPPTLPWPSPGQRQLLVVNDDNYK